MNRRSVHKIVLIAWIALFFLLGFGAWAFQGGELMIIVFLLLSVIAYVTYAFRARCTQCNMPLLLRPVNILGMELFVWSMVTPETCRHCGAGVGGKS